MTTPELLTVPIERLRVRPQVRTRIDDRKVRELAASIEAAGLQQPILCERDGDGYRVIDGHCRKLAMELLGHVEVPVLVVDPKAGQASALARALVCNLQRSDLDPVDRAMGLRQLKDSAGYTIEETARAVGLSAGSVTKSLRMAELPSQLLDRVQRGEVPADAAYLLARVADPQTQADMAARVARKELTRDRLAKEIKRSEALQHAKDRRPSVQAKLRVPAVRLRVNVGGLGFVVSGRTLAIDSLIAALQLLLARARRCKETGSPLQSLAEGN